MMTSCINPFNKETVVLADRFLRIEKKDVFEKTQITIKLSEEKFKEILDKFIIFAQK